MPRGPGRKALALLLARWQHKNAAAKPGSRDRLETVSATG
jgi:hypothetical protein